MNAISDKIKEVESEAIIGFESWWDNHVKLFLHDEVEPVLKTFFQQFTSDDGALILSEGVQAAKAIEAGTPFAAVSAALFTDLLSKSVTIAAADAGKTLLTIQSALQIGKANNGMLTASDQTIVAGAATI